MTKKIESFKKRTLRKYRNFMRKRKLRKLTRQARKEVRKLLKKFHVNFK